MNGSANGSSSAYSSTRAMRMGSQIEEPELAALPLELPARFALEHHRDQAVPRMKDQGMERPLDAGAVGGGVLGERSWKKGWNCTVSQPRRAYSRIMRPEQM